MVYDSISLLVIIMSGRGPESWDNENRVEFCLLILKFFKLVAEYL
jgi:hypothetical protein